jgi:hypothetical protein
MRRIAGILMAFMALAAPRSWSQATPTAAPADSAAAASLVRGARLRVTPAGGVPYTASLLTASPDTLSVWARGARVTMPVRSLARLELGHSHAALGIASGGLAGLAVAGLGGAGPIGTIMLVVFGGAIGGQMLPFETWQPVRLPHP